MISWIDKDADLFRVDISTSNFKNLGVKFLISLKESVTKFMESDERCLTCDDMESIMEMIRSGMFSSFAYSCVNDETTVGIVEYIDTNEWFMNVKIYNKTSIVYQWITKYIDENYDWFAQVRGFAVEDNDGNIIMDDIICFDLVDMS